MIERLLLKRIYQLDHLYGLLLTFGLALMIEGLFQLLLRRRRASPIPTPSSPAATISASCSCRPIAAGSWSRRCVICFGTWFAIERTRLGAYLRAATENPTLVQAFGINVPLLITLTYGAGRRRWPALAGVLAAPI